MNIRFDPPEVTEEYRERVLAILLEAAVPQARAALEKERGR